jgi:hypothetical protein
MTLITRVVRAAQAEPIGISRSPNGVVGSSGDGTVVQHYRNVDNSGQQDEIGSDQAS